VLRSRAGDLSFVKKSGGSLGDADEDAEQAEHAANLGSDDPRDHLHNSHWISGTGIGGDGGGAASAADRARLVRSGPSRYVAYYDATSLYPSSGERAKNRQYLAKRERERERDRCVYNF